jgi:hypothetical protein
MRMNEGKIHEENFDVCFSFFFRSNFRLQAASADFMSFHRLSDSRIDLGARGNKKAFARGKRAFYY